MVVDTRWCLAVAAHYSPRLPYAHGLRSILWVRTRRLTYNCVFTTRDCWTPHRCGMTFQIPGTPEAERLDPLVLSLVCVHSVTLSNISGSNDSLSASGKSRWRQLWNVILWKQCMKRTMCLGWGGENVRIRVRRARKGRQMVKQPKKKKNSTRCEDLTLKLLNGFYPSRW